MIFIVSAARFFLMRTKYTIHIEKFKNILKLSQYDSLNICNYVYIY